MIGERLKDIRDDKGFNQEEMAKIIGVSRSRYSMWEIDKETIPLKWLNSICNKFDISMDFIIGKTRTYNGNGIHELDKKEVGNRLRDIRKKNKVTQKELALILNTTQSAVCAYELGKNLLLTDFAIIIVNEFNISLDYLCCRINKEID